MKFVIRIPYSGLGDQLFFSPIPDLIKLSFPSSKVLVLLERGTRNSSITDLIWNTNPNVDEICYESNEQWPLPRIKVVSNDNLLARNAKSLGLACEPNLLPKIYTSIEIDKNYVNKTVVDLNYISFVGAISRKKLIKLFCDPNIYFVNRPDWIKTGKNVVPKSLFHYASIIKSSKEFHCLTSGGATLAAALGKPAKCYFGKGQDKMFHHCDFHEYVDVSDNLMKTAMVYLKYKTYTRLKRKVLEIVGRY